jgi:hypothetical protein
LSTAKSSNSKHGERANPLPNLQRALTADAIEVLRRIMVEVISANPSIWRHDYCSKTQK